MKGLSEEAFQRQWNEKHFSTSGDKALLYQVARRIFTQAELDTVLICLFKRIVDLKEATELTKFNPQPDLKADYNSLKKAQTALQEKSPIPLEFRPTSGEIDALLKRHMETENQYDVKKLELIQALRRSNEHEEFVIGLTALDKYPSTKPTNHVQNYFTCVLAEHFRRTTGQPDFPFIEQIVRGVFSGPKVKAAILRQRCHQFGKDFPHWKQVADGLFKGCEEIRVKPLSSPPTTPSENPPT
jgi:hypothetical protein